MLRLIWKTIKITILFLAVLFVADLGYVVAFGQYQPEVKNTDAVIILGAAINTPALYNRSLKGLDLYNQGKTKVLVLSGGRTSDKDLSEAGYMKKVIAKNSARPVPMILEETSRNTYENIKNSKAKIPEAKSVTIVSDRFHLARAVLVAKRAGFKDVYWAAPKPFYYRFSELSYYYLREAVAMFFYVPRFVAN